MLNNMEKETVVKCKKCGKYFGQTKEDPKCRFCNTGYDQVDEESAVKKLKVKTQKESFTIWKDDKRD